jgi:hypothetical protein
VKKWKKRGNVTAKKKEMIEIFFYMEGIFIFLYHHKKKI